MRHDKAADSWISSPPSPRATFKPCSIDGDCKRTMRGHESSHGTAQPQYSMILVAYRAARVSIVEGTNPLCKKGMQPSKINRYRQTDREPTPAAFVHPIFKILGSEPIPGLLSEARFGASRCRRLSARVVMTVQQCSPEFGPSGSAW